MVHSKIIIRLIIAAPIIAGTVYAMEQKEITSTVQQAPGTITPQETTPLNYQSMQGQIVPSLQQSGNFCGYYALFNAISFLNHQNNDQTNSERFRKFFVKKLAHIKQLRGTNLFDNLNAKELRALVPADQNIAVVEVATLFFAAQQPETTLNEALGPDNLNTNIANPSKLLRRFISGKSDEVSIVALIGRYQGGIINHWIAIHAQRNASKQVTIQIADSIGMLGAKTPEATIRKSILPFYLALTTPIEQWSTVLTDQLREEVLGKEYQCNPDEQYKKTIIEFFIESATEQYKHIALMQKELTGTIPDGSQLMKTFSEAFEFTLKEVLRCTDGQLSANNSTSLIELRYERLESLRLLIKRISSLFSLVCTDNAINEGNKLNVFVDHFRELHQSITHEYTLLEGLKNKKHTSVKQLSDINHTNNAEKPTVFISATVNESGLKISRQELIKLINEIEQHTFIDATHGAQELAHWQAVLHTIEQEAATPQHWYSRAKPETVFYDLLHCLLQRLIKDCQAYLNQAETKRTKFTALREQCCKEEPCKNWINTLCITAHEAANYLTSEKELLDGLCTKKIALIEQLQKLYQLYGRTENSLQAQLTLATDAQKHLEDSYVQLFQQLQKIIKQIEAHGVILQTPTSKTSKADLTRDKADITQDKEVMALFTERARNCFSSACRIDHDLQETILRDCPESATALQLLNGESDLRNNILIIGTHGLGKSALAQAIGKKCGWERVLWVQGALVNNEYKNSGEQCIAELFAPLLADPSKRWLMIIDEIDAIKGTYTDRGTHATRSNAITSLGLALDRCELLRHMAVMGTTWCPELLPADFRSRFLVTITMAANDPTVRKKIFLRELLKLRRVAFDHSLNMKQINYVLNETLDQNIRDMQAICGNAALKAPNSATANGMRLLTSNLLITAMQQRKTALTTRGIPEDQDPEQVALVAQQKSVSVARIGVISASALGAGSLLLAYYTHNQSLAASAQQLAQAAAANAAAQKSASVSNAIGGMSLGAAAIGVGLAAKAACYGTLALGVGTGGIVVFGCALSYGLYKIL